MKANLGASGPVLVNTDGTSVFDVLARLITNTLGLGSIPAVAPKRTLIPGPLADIQPSAAEEYDPIQERKLEWSTQAEALMQTARKSPWLIDDAYVLATLKNAVVVDRECESLGGDLKRFVNLTELSLTGNAFSEIPGNQLPPALQILHACANRMDSLSALSAGCPASLCHLGVSCNRFLQLSPLELSPSRWPNLMSLDVSFNDLDDLPAFAETVAQVPSLKVLVALGNPFALLPWYRTYLVNVTKQIAYLDDKVVDPEARLEGGVPEDQDLTPATKVSIEIRGIEALADPFYDPAYVPPPVDPKAKKGKMVGAGDPPNKVYTYQVVVEFPNNSADPDVTQEIGSTVPTPTQTADGDENGVADEGEAAAAAAGAGAPIGGVSVTDGIRWDRTMTYGKTFDFEIQDLRGFKAACVNGCRLELYETMVESIKVEAGPLPPGEKPKKKKADDPVVMRELPPVVRFVGSAFFSTLPLLEGADGVANELPLTDSKGNELAGYIVPREPAEPGDEDKPEEPRGPAVPLISAVISLPRVTFTDASA